jgi:anti-sigma28 factor (negative regulator of flagellin synthesis)
MRITDRYQGLMERVGAGATRPVDKAGRAESGARAKGKASEGALEVSVSDRAQELAAGAARLEELRTAIKDGSFVVDSERIARRLVGLLGEGDE